MKGSIYNNYIVLQAVENFEETILQDLYRKYSYKDKSAERQLKNFKLTLRQMEEKYDGNPPAWFDPWRNKKLAELISEQIRYACEFHGETLLVPIGLLQDVQQELGPKFRPIDIRDFDVNRRILTGSQFKLRTPQSKALQIVKDLSATCGLIRMATGVGKTALGQEIIRHYGLPTIFLVPSVPILNQTVERFQAAFGRRNVGVYGDGKKRHSYITVATYQGVNLADPEDFKDYKLAVFDEVHHVAADTFFNVATKCLPNLLYRYGLTADEERADGGTVFVTAATGPVIYSYEADEAIRDGYLATPTFVIYQVTQTSGQYIDWRTDKKTNKRYQVGIKQSEAYTRSNAHLAYKNWVLGNDELVGSVSNLINAFNSAGKSVLMLINEKEHAEKFKQYLPNAGYVYGGLSTNEDLQRKFNDRKLKTIIATSTLGEGADTVPVDVLINLMGNTRPKQANGRALRNDNGKKPTTIIIDFDYPNSPVLHRHSLERQKIHKTYVGRIHDYRTLI
jgi:superfamily II DNA or RNA helicase